MGNPFGPMWINTTRIRTNSLFRPAPQIRRHHIVAVSRGVNYLTNVLLIVYSLTPEPTGAFSFFQSINNNTMYRYGHWICDFEFDPTEWYGFIYRIIDHNNGKHYIGKKQFLSRLRKKIPGKKNRKIVYKETKWQTYTSSSKHLNEQIETNSIDNFEFRILSLHETKASLYYAEVRLQVLEDVLRATQPNGERKYYNGQIGAVKFLPPQPTEKEMKHSTVQHECKSCHQ